MHIHTCIYVNHINTHMHDAYTASDFIQPSRCSHIVPHQACLQQQDMFAAVQSPPLARPGMIRLRNAVGACNAAQGEAKNNVSTQDAGRYTVAPCSAGDA